MEMARRVKTSRPTFAPWPVSLNSWPGKAGSGAGGSRRGLHAQVRLTQINARQLAQASGRSRTRAMRPLGAFASRPRGHRHRPLSFMAYGLGEWTAEETDPSSHSDWMLRLQGWAFRLRIGERGRRVSRMCCSFCCPRVRSRIPGL